ncbi:MAG: hypothetical protein DCC67_07170 [Planctomycetota bacterium]|nr:MAG: hypothetical protein DCC67_07170 [Planctomycetota bacterium]
MAWLFAGLATAACPPGAAAAADRIIALTGNSVPGVAGAQLEGFSGATINAAGQVAFEATLKPGGGVTSANNLTVWRVSDATREVLARTGSTAPGGGLFTGFEASSISDDGGVVVGGMRDGVRGVWRYAAPPASGALVAVVGQAPSPDLDQTQLDVIYRPPMQSNAGHVAFDGGLRVGVGGVTNVNDRGLWLSFGGHNQLVTREGAAAPGVNGGQFSTMLPLGVNQLGQSVVVASLKIDGVFITASSNQGIWRLQPGGGTLIARTGSGDVPGLPGASFAIFGVPAINGLGEIAFNAGLAHGGGITSLNDAGVWYSDGTKAALVAQTGAAAPGTGGALFGELFPPLLNDAGELLVSGTLLPGVGGVVDANALGMWLIKPGGSGGALVARTGSGGVPGVPGASFAGFQGAALNASGQIALLATLAVGTGGVTENDNQGIWLLDGPGSGTLVARRGQAIAGRTVSSLDFTGSSGGGDGRPRALNASGELAYRATFSSGEQALVVHTPLGGLAGDFDADGDVDGIDLAHWKAHYGLPTGAAKSQGDADGDGDVDGGDFLFWQRDRTAAPAAPIPEPAGLALLAAGGLARAAQRRGRRGAGNGTD